MKLSQYLKRDGALTLSELSDRLSVSKGRLSQLRNSADWPPDLALRAEKETDGLLDASALSGIIARARQVAA